MSAGMKKTGALFGIMALVTIIGAVITLGVRRLDGETAHNEDTFRIATSFYPMYIAGLNLVDGIEGVELVGLTENQGGCLHDYQLTAADMKKLENADVLIINGGGMEVFLDKIEKAYPKLPIIDASEGIESEDGNAHYWVDPEKYKKQLINMEKGLSRLDKVHKDSYAKNCRSYIEKVDGLEAKMLSEAAGFSKEKAVLFHDAFYYLAERLGVETVYSIELEADSSLNTGEIAEIVDRVKKEGVRLLFTEKQFSDSIPLGISRETGAKLCVVDTLVSGELTKDAYLNGMEENLKAVADCLHGLD